VIPKRKQLGLHHVFLTNQSTEVLSIQQHNRKQQSKSKIWQTFIPNPVRQLSVTFDAWVISLLFQSLIKLVKYIFELSGEMFMGWEAYV
jgi:hypothetical protein